MDRGGCRFAFLKEKFPRINVEKLKAGIFDGPQIRELMKDPMFDEALIKAKLSARQSLKLVVKDFLGKYLSAEYMKEIEGLPKSFCQHGARMSVKLHFLCLHLDYFPKNCEDLSEEQGEHFHRDIHIMEECYQGRWDVIFITDYCWCLIRDTVAAEHSRKFLNLLLCVFHFTLA